MFDFLISGAVKQDAAVLKKITDVTLSKFLNLSVPELIESIKSDSGIKNVIVESDFIQFEYKDMKDYCFCFEGLNNDVFGTTLEINGIGVYNGFILQVTGINKKDELGWQVMYVDEGGFATTAGAKKLVKVMSKEYGITDCNALTKSFGF